MPRDFNLGIVAKAQQEGGEKKRLPSTLLGTMIDNCISQLNQIKPYLALTKSALLCITY